MATQQQPSATSIKNGTADDPEAEGTAPQTSVGLEEKEMEEEEEQGDLMTFEPTQDELEKERLTARAEQLQDEILSLRQSLQEKEEELADVKAELGITPFVEFKQSMAHGMKVMGDKWKEVQDTETFRKIDDKLAGWKQRMEDSETYQKTKQGLGDGGKRAGDALSSAGSKIKESETVKVIGEKTSAALKRTGTAIRDTSSAIKDRVMASFDYGDGTASPQDEAPQETVVPDEPTKE